MKIVSIATLLVLTLLTNACSSVPKAKKYSRPESINVPTEFIVENGGSLMFRGSTLFVPSGRYIFIREGEGAFMYAASGSMGQSSIDGRSPAKGEAIIAISKDYDQIAYYLALNDGDIRSRGAGELVVLMLPKFNGKRISLEGLIPNELAREKLEMIGNVPVVR